MVIYLDITQPIASPPLKIPPHPPQCSQQIVYYVLFVRANFAPGKVYQFITGIKIARPIWLGIVGSGWVCLVVAGWRWFGMVGDSLVTHTHTHTLNKKPKFAWPFTCKNTHITTEKLFSFKS